jgi:phosphonate transport system substrate-binding protein
MSDLSGSVPNSSPAASPNSEHAGGLFRTVAIMGLAGALGVIAYNGYYTMQARAVMQATDARLAEMRGLVAPVHKHLASEYSDKDGNLLADTPSKPDELLDPETLMLAHYIDADVEQQLVDWEALRAALAQATGKNIILQEYQNTADDVATIKQGLIQIVAMHAADAPYVVNNAGYVPFAVLGTEPGSAHGNRLDIAVAPDSKIQQLADLRGKKLTCTAPDSMTGYRAAIIALSQQAGLQPDVDYTIAFSLGQKRSVLGLVAGEFAVSALSYDKLQSMIKKGDVQPDDLKLIYQSEVIPRLTIGYVYNLNPELAEKIQSTILAFANEGGSPDDLTGSPMRFFESDYRTDFQFVRNVDDNFDPRFFKASKNKPAQRPAPPASE